MLRSSFSIGRWMGVDIRLHISLPILLIGALIYGGVATGNAMRGLGLWFALVCALLVRETARLIAAAYTGLRVRALFVLPVGGIMALAPQPGGEPPETRLVTIAAPLANFAAALLLLGFAYAVDPRAQMLAQPWVSPAHILRSLLWTQVALGLVNLLPTAAMPTRQMLRARGRSIFTGGAAFSLGTMLALAMLVAGFVTLNLWIIIAAAFVLLAAQMQASPTAAQPESDNILVRDVMLTEFMLLSTSDTLEGALQRTVHSLQDVFPVVRGDRLAGAVARQTMLDHLQSEGDGYLQGVMTRQLQVASPDEPLLGALRRAAGLGASEFIPVAENGRLLGILSPQSLGRAVQQMKLTTPKPEERQARS